MKPNDMVHLVLWGSLVFTYFAFPVGALSIVDKESLYGRKTEERLVHVTVVEGQSAELPCDPAGPVSATVTNPADSPRLVLWYYASVGTIYTYDARGGPGEAGSHWTSERQLPGAGRLRFLADGTPPVLRISAVSRADSGVYRCRVDYLLSPTQNSRVNLTVIVPPQMPVIVDSAGDRVQGGILGPFRIGDQANFTCVAYDGSPTPNVTWWRGVTRVGGDWFSADTDRSVRAELTLETLRRADHDTKYTCLATFLASQPGLSTTAVVQMILPPLSAVITSPAELSVAADESATLTCVVTGSRPAPTIRWLLGNVRAPGVAKETTEVDSIITTSRLTFTPRMSDHGQMVRCVASNALAGAETAQHTHTLSVSYAPLVTLTMRPVDGVRSGDTVRMQCDVKARPAVAAETIRWRHGAVWLPDGVSGGRVRVSSGVSALTLVGVTPASSGNYSCVATNQLGTTHSNTMQLRVQHLPECSVGSRQQREAARGVTLNVTCHTEAQPAAHRYRWSFNASPVSGGAGGLPLVPVPLLAGGANSSVLLYTPRMPRDFGELLCWATNAVGEQTQPCRLLIVPADVPESVVDCGVSNRTTVSLEVHCTPGFDGGLQQTFEMAVYDAANNQLLVNITNTVPRFGVLGLPEGRELAVSVVARNGRGSSLQYSLQTSTLPQRTVHATSPLGRFLRFTPVLGVMAGIVVALVLTALVVASTRRRAHLPHSKERQQAVCHVQLVRGCQLSEDNCDDLEKHQDPDLIPQTATAECVEAEEKYMLERLQAGTQFPLPTPTFDDYPPTSLRSRSRSRSPERCHVGVGSLNHTLPRRCTTPGRHYCHAGHSPVEETSWRR